MQAETSRINRQTIQLEKFMANPMLMDDQSIDLLWQMVKEYPFFQTARMLLAKNLDMAGHEAYPLSLRLAAAYAGDRRLLKKLMDTRTVGALTDEKMLVEEVDGKVELDREDEEVRGSEFEVQGSEFGVRGLEVDGKVELDREDEEVRGSEFEVRGLEFGVRGIEVDGKVELDREDEEVRGSEFEVQGSEFGVRGIEVDEEVKVDRVDEEVQGSEFEVRGLEVDREVELDRVDEGVRGSEFEVQGSKEDEKINQDVEESEPQLSPLVNLIKSSLKEIGQERSLDPSGSESARTGRRMDPKERNALIEKFITEEPRISAPKKEFFNPLDHARQSSVEHEDLVTETLARIFEQQGHTLKAIKIYEKLMLLIPEKSNYFAARIVELRQLLK